MKNIFVPIFLLSVPIILQAQIFKVNIEVDNIPVYHSWSQQDYDCGIKYVYTHGTDSTFQGIYDSWTSKYGLFFNKRMQSNDSIQYSERVDHPDLITVVFDKNSALFKNITYSYDDWTIHPNIDKFFFNINNIPAIATDSSYYFTLIGKQVSGHGLVFSKDTHSETNVSIYRTDSYANLDYISDSSLVTFSITRGSLLSVAANKKGERNLSIFPLPAMNEIHISFHNIRNVNAISVLNILGHEVINIPIENGATDMLLSTKSLLPGIYFLRAGNQMQKFVIQR